MASAPSGKDAAVQRTSGFCSFPVHSRKSARRRPAHRRAQACGHGHERAQEVRVRWRQSGFSPPSPLHRRRSGGAAEPSLKRLAPREDGARVAVPIGPSDAPCGLAGGRPQHSFHEANAGRLRDSTGDGAGLDRRFGARGAAPFQEGR